MELELRRRAPMSTNDPSSLRTVDAKVRSEEEARREERERGREGEREGWVSGMGGEKRVRGESEARG
eukprot:331579-Rhodomonas_salina.1